MSGVQDFRLEHNLTSDSIVFEVGGFTGDFSDRIINKFGCNVCIFEPIIEYYEYLKLKYSSNSKIKVFNYGLESFSGNKPITLSNDGSSIYATVGGLTQMVLLRNVNDVLKELGFEKIDLIELNCEGSEYSILTELHAGPYMSIIETIQIQFHKIDSIVYEKEKAKCREYLATTHTLMWDKPHDNFECWALTKP